MTILNRHSERAVTFLPGQVRLLHVRIDGRRIEDFNDEDLRLEELAADLSEHGVKKPVIVMDRDHFRVVVDGTRRARAAVIAGVDLPSVLVTCKCTKNGIEPCSHVRVLIQQNQREN